MDSSIFFSSEQQGDVLVVSLLRSMGSFVEEDARGEWNQLLALADHPDIKHVLLDFATLAYFGSTLLEWMVTLWKKLRDKSSDLTICNLSDVGLEILHTAKFDTLWAVFKTREEAIESFSS